LAKVFKAFDKGGDGQLSMEEVKTGYKEHYGKLVADEEVEKMFKAVDCDNSGFIDYNEFVIAAMNEQEITSNEFLSAAFKMFDKDGSGVISADEIKTVLGFGEATMAPDAIQKIVKEIEVTNEGEISFEEFTEMMKKMGK
jgi:calcium-dependent protein kinase